MRRDIYRQQRRGQSLIEILFAITIFTIGVLTIGYLIIDARTSLARNIEFEQARLLAHEGIEAARSIRDYNFDDMGEGQSGITLQNGRWVLSAPSSDTTGKFTRTVQILNVEEGVKQVTSAVTWDTDTRAPREVSFTSYLTDWRRNQGDASALRIDTTAAVVSETGETVSGARIENISAAAITVARLMLTWDNDSTLEEVVIGGVTVFPGSGLTSGVDIDIDDYALAPGVPVTVDTLRFSGPMDNTDISLLFTMTDESRQTGIIDLVP